MNLHFEVQVVEQVRTDDLSIGSRDGPVDMEIFPVVLNDVKVADH
jgi:hypothetical protein